MVHRTPKRMSTNDRAARELLTGNNYLTMFSQLPKLKRISEASGPLLGAPGPLLGTSGPLLGAPSTQTQQQEGESILAIHSAAAARILNWRNGTFNMLNRVAQEFDDLGLRRPNTAEEDDGFEFEVDPEAKRRARQLRKMRTRSK